MSGQSFESGLPAGARRVRSRGGARRWLRAAGVVGILALAALVPATVAAHPLGNFTINHYAGIRVAADRVSLDVVIDRAEIPGFQEQQRLDTDRNGRLSATELAGQDRAACLALAGDLRVALDRSALAPSLVAAGLAFPPGAGGLPTMRLVCEYEAILAAPIRDGATFTFVDGSFAERIGWREIVIAGDGVTLTRAGAGDSAADMTAGGVSNRLTAYPEGLLSQPLDERGATVTVTPGGPTLAPWTAPDAQPILEPDGAATPPAGSAVGAVPGGIAEDLASLVDVEDLTPLAILASLAVAFGLGIVHALSPGHGKTIMAAYLVGGRGSSRQAVGLGLAVTVSHTLGVLALAGITLAASSVLPPERLYPILGVVSGGLVIAIGASLLWSRLRGLAGARGSHGHGHGHVHGDEHGDGHSPGHDHPHPHDHGQPHGHAHPHESGHPHPHPHDHAPAGDGISWRGLLALGLSGGLVPSASALILLLGSIAAGRVAYGLVLVLGFGAGMAVVLAGIGVLLVHARRLVERSLDRGRAAAGLRRAVVPVQLATASLVVVLGIVLTGQALTQVL